MYEMLTRFFGDLGDRLHGLMNFRFYMQPLMAMLFAILDGRKDARAGRSLYFWELFTTAPERREMFRSGWKSVGKIFILALVLDAVYQYRVLSWFYPVEAIVVAIALAIIPYLLLRGPANRLFRYIGKKAATDPGLRGKQS